MDPDLELLLSLLGKGVKAALASTSGCDSVISTNSTSSTTPVSISPTLPPSNDVIDDNEDVETNEPCSPTPSPTAEDDIVGPEFIQQYAKFRQLNQEEKTKATLLIEGNAPTSSIARLLSKSKGTTILPKQISNLK